MTDTSYLYQYFLDNSTNDKKEESVSSKRDDSTNVKQPDEKSKQEASA